MDIIYRMLKEFRYILRNRQIKRLITLVLIIILLSMLCSRVFASVSVEYNNGATKTLPDFPSNLGSYWFIASDDSYNKCFLITSNSEMYIDVTENNRS